MKKLITTAIVAAAAFGAFAIETGVRFESLELGATSVSALNGPTGDYDYWDEPEGAENTYTVVEMDAYTGTRPAAFTNETSSLKALSVKTTFGQPLSFSVNADVEGAAVAQDIGTGLYFDGLTKFTVCEEAPEVNSYEGAKIVMWLQEQYDEDDNVTGTNLMVRAGYLSYENQVIVVSNAVYTCDQITAPGFADAWHRVTIKTIADITEGAGVPGFAIYIDGEIKSTGDIDKWDASFAEQYGISEIASNLDGQHAIFPSLIQAGGDKTKIYSASFDGTGSINELQFTATAPTFASDEQYMEPKFSYSYDVGEESVTESFKTIDALINRIAEFGAGEYTIALLQNINIDSSIEIANANQAEIILDLNGCTIENSAGYAITVKRGTWMKIIDSSDLKTGAIVSDFDNGGTVYVENEAQLTLVSGKLDGAIECAPIQGEGTDDEIVAGVAILMGGMVKYDNIDPADGFALVERDGFYDVVVAFDVTFVLDNGSENVVVENVATGTLASEVRPANPTREGYTFTGWDPAIDENTTITADITFTAQWEAVAVTTYTIAVGAPGAGVTVAVVTNGVAAGSAAGDYVVNAGGSATVTYTANAGYELTGQAEFTFENIAANQSTTAPTATAIAYAITYVLNGGTQAADPVTSYTVESEPITLPTPTYTGYTFNGWTNETFTTAIKTYAVDPAKLGNIKFYASWTAVSPAAPVIPEDASSVVVDGAEGADPATIAASVTVAVPAAATEAGVTADTYQGYFTKTATYADGKWTVTAEIAETVKQAVAKSATAVLEAASGESVNVAVPVGLYYKITTMTDLQREPTAVEAGLSETGVNIPVTKPGDNAGFIKIQLGTKSFE